MTVNTGNGLRPMLSSKSIAKTIDLPVKTFRKLVASQRFPRPDIRIGRQYRWYTDTVLKALEDLKF